MDSIIEYFRTDTPVSDQAWSYFRKHLDVHHYNNGDIIHPKQEPCDKLSFILQGIARSYLHKSDGRDFTWFFHYVDENNSAKQFILADFPSFNMQTPSTYGFQALSRCHVAYITYHNLMNVFQRFPEFLAVEKQLIINAYRHNEKRLQSLLTQSAKGRLKDFEQENGFLFNVIPHYHIASFLGISPQRLCQLRRI
jgi:CRP-like cAMP-binding protein